MDLLIPVASGLEQITKRQLLALGYEKAPAQNGRIEVQGDWQDIARLNVFLRSGERVLLRLATFHATTFDDLYEGVYNIPWENYLQIDSQILMDGKSVQSTLAAIKASGGVAKKAVIRRLGDKLNSGRKTFSETGARSIIGISIFKDEVTVTLDTTGEGLHKRGYRSLAYSAPLKETLAAALIDSSFYNPDNDEEKPFADVFCGSGTLPIEAALKGMRIAPGLHRDFDFTHWKCAPIGVLNTAKEEARDKENQGAKLQIFASDINPQAISIAKYHAKRAGVEDKIHFSIADARKFTSEQKYGVLMSNPPYGERLSDEAEVRKLMSDFGKTFRALPDWNAYVLTSLPEFERYFGKRADKKKKLFNANLVCGFYSYYGAPPQRFDESRISNPISKGEK
ncbi:MAG: class I SAM-dependent RNA methyltransferase [Clostridiales bacterium]|nr:class I SAM-dependent RNA methyltransferase [Clostridiales bacterium]